MDIVVDLTIVLVVLDYCPLQQGLRLTRNHHVIATAKILDYCPLQQGLFLPYSSYVSWCCCFSTKYIDELI